MAECSDFQHFCQYTHKETNKVSGGFHLIMSWLKCCSVDVSVFAHKAPIITSE
ncbi:unnamed protein product [Sphenostylis stenocarpa]|uniref:Uncharacterized protein n=1 Tax=Sphenostylis stenocarpa TaxID=92480 RepID=A0AA86W3G9_9FABA|nr:unnamed protein product [Sphenostylis stenocarpa]